MSRSIFRKVALDRLSTPDELDQLPRVATSTGWLALLACAGLLLAMLLWSVFATIPTTVHGTGILTTLGAEPEQLAAVVYLPIEDGSSLRPGMEAKIELVTSPERERGFLLGRVTTIATLPANREAMLRVLESDAFVQALIDRGAILEVRVALARDPATGWRQWSIPGSGDVDVTGGTLCAATITVARQRPISFVTP